MGKKMIDFEVINPDGRAVMGASSINCLPTNEQLISMSKAGYKFKLNKKAISLKKLKSFISEGNDNE